MTKLFTDRVLFFTAVMFILINIGFFGYYFVFKTENTDSAQKLTLASINEKVDVLSVSSLSDTEKIAFVGDIMFDRYIRQVAEEKGYSYILKDVKNVFEGTDYVVGNLEGPVTDFDSISIDSEIGEHDNYVFTMDEEALDTLYDANIRILNIGNNHINNFGSDGIKKTKEYLDMYGIGFFGDLAVSSSVSSNPFVIDKQNFRINIFNYNQFGGKSAQELNVELSKYEKPGEISIVYAHWGDEYLDVAPDYIIKIAESFVDSGADLIIGAHPHVVQNVDSYKGKKIYYSLGNFVMDQYFDEQVRKGLVVFAEISLNEIDTSSLFIYLNDNGQTVPLSSE